MRRRDDPIRGRRRERGMILITALGVIIVLSGLVLVLAQSMRTEAIASANRLALEQADAVEQGAEQWVMAQAETYTTDALTMTQIPAAGLQVGSGYFWLLSPNYTTDQQYQFGIVDECGKLNINNANASQLQELPTTLMTQPIADAIGDWRNPVNKQSSDGAESSYYESLAEPYECKNEPYETVEELLLVKGVTPEMLFGEDLNRNGVTEPAEQAAAAAGGMSFTVNTTATSDSRGIFDYLTCYSAAGKINVNTAPLQVLMTIPGMNNSDAEAIVNARSSQSNTSNVQWISGVIPASDAALILPYITAVSNQYSADIVAVSGDGRAFKRVRIVVDSTQSPPKIVYRKDMTALGWPLPQSVRDALRAGQGVPVEFQASGATAQ